MTIMKVSGKLGKRSVNSILIQCFPGFQKYSDWDFLRKEVCRVFFGRGWSMTVMMLSYCRTDCWVDRLGDLKVGQG